MRAVGLLGVISLACLSLAISQTNPLIVPGVDEPPELTGKAKEVLPPSATDQEFFDALKNIKENDSQSLRVAIVDLNRFLKAHPNSSDAYLMRATVNICMLDGHDYAAALADVDTAITKHKSSRTASMYSNLADFYSLRSRLNFSLGHFREAMSDLDAAMKEDYGSADKVFNSAAVAPERTAKPCSWSLSDFDVLKSSFPVDYRPRMFKGLYYFFFTTFSEQFYGDALANVRSAVALSPRTAVPRYFLGRLYTKQSFWTKAAWGSDQKRDEATRLALQQYTLALQIDHNFLPAIEERASAYLNLKRYREAIQDYDHVLELDPENVIAYADRGMANLEMGRYIASTSDYSEAIRRRKEGNASLSNEYVNRGDAYLKGGDYRRAISDYTNAIRERLANDTFLMSVAQFRGLYPEYDSVSDEVLVRKLNALFWPGFSYEQYSKQLAKNGSWGLSLLNDLYEKRGDAYIQSGDFRRGVLDFQRITHGMPDFADTFDRWRPLGIDADGATIFLDVKSARFSADGGTVWIKSVTKRKTSTVTGFELSCSQRRLRQLSTIEYDVKDNAVSSSDEPTGWATVIPSTRGEQLYEGGCSNHTVASNRPDR